MASAAVIGALRVVLGADTASFEAGMKRATGSLGGLSGGAKLAGLGIAAGLAAGAVAAVGLAKSLKGVIDHADELSKASAKFGIGIEALSKLEYAGKLADVSFESLTKGVGKLEKTMYSAATGSKAAVATFSALGVKVTDSTGALRGADDVVADVAESFANMQDGAAKTALAMQTFGKAGADMIPLLNDGKDGLNAMYQEAEALGLVLDETTGKAAEAFNDNLTRVAAVAEGLQTRIAAALLPTLVDLSAVFVDAAKDASFVAETSAVLDGTMRALITTGLVLGGTFKGVWDTVAFLGRALGHLGESIKAVSEGRRGSFAADISKDWKTWDAQMTRTVTGTSQMITKVWAQHGAAMAKATPKAPKGVNPVLGGDDNGAAAKAAKAAKKDADEAKKALDDLQRDVDSALQSLEGSSERFARVEAEKTKIFIEAFKARLLTAQQVTKAVEDLEIQRIGKFGLADKVDRVPVTMDTPGMQWADDFFSAMQDQADEQTQYWADVVSGGTRAAFDGDLASFLSSWLKDAASDALSPIMQKLAQSVGGFLKNAVSGATSTSGGGGLSSILGSAGKLIPGLASAFGGTAAHAATVGTAISSTFAAGGTAAAAGAAGTAAAGVGGLSGMLGSAGALLASNPIGWGIAAVGGVALLFKAFSGGAKKAAKEAARAKEREETLARVREEATKIAEDLAAAEEKVKRVQAEHEDLLIRFMTASGDTSGALAATRAKELAAIDASNRALLEATYQWEDYKTALEASAQAVADAASAVADARAEVQAAYDREAGGIQKTIDALNGTIDSLQEVRSGIEATRDKFQDLSQTLRDFLADMSASEQNIGSPGDRLALLGIRFQETARRAARNDEKAQAQLLGVTQDYLDVSRETAKTALDYDRKAAEIRAGINTVATASDNQVDLAVQQLNQTDAQIAAQEAQVAAQEANLAALQEMVDAALGTKAATLTVVEAINNLNAAMGAQRAALQAQEALKATPPPSTPPADPAASAPAAADWSVGGELWNQQAALGRTNSYVMGVGPDKTLIDWAARPSNFLQEYNNFKSAGLTLQALNAYWQLPSGTAQVFADRYGVPRFKTGGSFQVGGSGGADSQLVAMWNTPGEHVNISKQDSMANLADEMEVLKSVMVQVAINTGQGATILRRWNGDGMPETRDLDAA